MSVRAATHPTGTPRPPLFGIKMRTLERNLYVNLAAHILLIISILIIVFPAIYASSSAPSACRKRTSSRPAFCPAPTRRPTTPEAWRTVNMGRLLFNSAFMSVTVSLGKIVLSVMAAFAFVYFGDFRGKNLFFVLILITHMLPLPIRIVPTFELMKNLGWINTYYGLTIPFFASATGTLLFRQFFLTVPHALVDAARTDGAGPLRFLWSILLPLSRTNLAALFMIEFIHMWNQYLWPLIVTTSADMRVVQIGLKLLVAGEQIAAGVEHRHGGDHHQHPPAPHRPAPAAAELCGGFCPAAGKVARKSEPPLATGRALNLSPLYKVGKR